VGLRATKLDGKQFAVWWLGIEYPRARVPEATAGAWRYLVQIDDGPPREYVHRITQRPVLPALGAWEWLWPRPVGGRFEGGIAAEGVTWLGHEYRRQAVEAGAVFRPPGAVRRFELQPDVLVGVPSNMRTRDDVRRFDGSEYAMVRLSQDDFARMIDAGLNCFRVDAEQARWLDDRPVFYWGIGAGDVAYPEGLFDSRFLGAALFLDEPAVGTRDHVIRPRLGRDPALRHGLTPQAMFEAFRTHYHEAVHGGAPRAFVKGLRGRADVDPGTLDFAQANLYSWETMVASAAWQLTAEPNGGPRAIVFEPPGRLGSWRTLPEMNMAYGCQLAPGNPAHLGDMILGFLRGAARASGGDWGVSIYGAVDRADAPWLLTRAYDLGATHFFFWDNYQLACVPHGEVLALARHLQAHALSHPQRDLDRLKRAGEVAMLLPPGYDLGHVHMGRGNLWGLGELNLERTNRFGIRYRQVMANLFAEIEQCLKRGVGFDVLWDIDALRLDGYREVVRIIEDGRVEVRSGATRSMLPGARTPDREAGQGPRIDLVLEDGVGVGAFPRTAGAHARVTEGSAPVYYTTGADRDGVHHNAVVFWELFGPEDEDYRALLEPGAHPAVRRDGLVAEIDLRFRIDRPGNYRLRAATSDRAGRSAVAWAAFTVGP
jgi:hypothetical protein